jgi:hypothetical protein
MGVTGPGSSRLDPLLRLEHDGVLQGQVFAQMTRDEEILQDEFMGLPAHLLEDVAVLEQVPDAQGGALGRVDEEIRYGGSPPGV